MIKKIKLTVLITIVFSNIYVFSQENSKTRKYVIILFESKFNNGLHGKSIDYWIIAQDSINGNSFQLNPLLLTDFSKDILSDCLQGKKIDPFVITKKTEYDFDSNYINSVEALKQIIEKNGQIIQRVSKKWHLGKKEKIRIFGVPINGNFCEGIYSGNGEQNIRHFVLPISSFKYDEGFWHSPQAEIFKKQDFYNKNTSIH